MRSDRGSTMPLILGFTLLALLMVAGAITAGQAFVHQRDLQHLCDGAAAAAAASAADLHRDAALAKGGALRFAQVPTAVAAYLARDPARGGVLVRSALSADARTITLSCVETRPVVFGAAFGKSGGLRHAVTSAARAPIR